MTPVSRSPVDVLKDLLQWGTWWPTAIELSGLVNGEDLQVEAAAAIEAYTVPRCDQCRWWDRLPEFSDAHPAHASEPATDWGICEIASARWGVVDHCETRMAATAGTVVTLQDFGCVQWEAKGGK